ncbi:MAG: hypothetical protein JST80_10050 [Bdellovibrionales bacterium]|nr:hypothetical protein [Bdellovibrionales bacterium]
MLKLLLLASLLHFPVSAHADDVITHIGSMLEQAIRVEANNGNKSNGKFLKKTQKMLNTAQFLWGIEQGCEKGSKNTMAYVPVVDARKSSRLVYVCRLAMDALDQDQLSHVILHELAHLQGVTDESQANFVADRVFADCGMVNPFLFKDFKDALNFQLKIEPGHEKDVEAILSTPEILEYVMNTAKKKNLWSEADQAWLFESYPDQARSDHASSKHVFFELGPIILHKTRVLSND